ncbi:gluconokinase [Deinobacterium chartae]|uniref:Gluconokinase n=1 Tax=Deinobacterium chartae TaxID=521158 RepID=A0A841HUL1_9DEIO|nr:gluconokinase [Deinobacterium chartae]MBB6096606.1 gluconokinase [Deinobacterium chartae]
MPIPPVTVGFDFGTTALKAVLFQGAQELHRLSFPYPLHADLPGQATQALHDLQQAFSEALEGVESYCASSGLQPQAVGFSNAMHSLVLLGEQGPSDVYTWADSRASTGGLPVSHLYARTGVPYHPMTPAVKLVWLRASQDPRSWKAVSGVKEEVLRRYFGVFWTDVSTAAATGLMHTDGHYDPQALALAGITEAQLPRIVPVDQALPAMLHPYRERYPRLAAAHWVIGANDGATATEGLGIVRPSQAAVSVGTSTAIRTFTPTPLLDPEARLFCYRVDERFLVGGASNNGGLVLGWLREHLEVPRDLDDLIYATTPGARGLLFLPALTGERAPFWDPTLSGSLLGLGMHHTPPDIARAGMEGVALHLAWLADLLRERVGPLEEIRVTGGLTRSRAWLQLLANALGQAVSVAEDADLFEGSAFGAACIAARGAGYTLSAERRYTHIAPNAERARYEQLGRRYRHAALALRDLTHALHDEGSVTIR